MRQFRAKSLQLTINPTGKDRGVSPIDRLIGGGRSIVCDSPFHITWVRVFRFWLTSIAQKCKKFVGNWATRICKGSVCEVCNSS